MNKIILLHSMNRTYMNTNEDENTLIKSNNVLKHGDWELDQCYFTY
jgi:hypothetical protein